MLGPGKGFGQGADERAMAGASESHGRELAGGSGRHLPASEWDGNLLPGFIAARCVLASSLTLTCPHLGFERARLAEFLR